MRHIRDPFPPTPEGFSMRVERTLFALEDVDMKKINLQRKLILLVAALFAALLAATAVAAIGGHSNFKARLEDEDAGEVAALVEEAHVAAPGGGEADFAFSVDEIIWEDDSLFISYSLSVPEDGGYMVAMDTPTLNGKKLAYDAKGFTMPKFFDLTGDGQYPTVLLLGGGHKTACNDLWTFRVDPALRERKDNRLKFRAVLLKTDLDLPFGGDPSDMLDPPDYFAFTKDWRTEAAMDAGAFDQYSDDAREMLDALNEVWPEDGALTPEALLDTGYAEYVAQREIDMTLDATRLPQVLYNDVAERDFDVDGVHLHVDRFRMTHLGASIDYTLSVPGAAPDDREAMRKLNAALEHNWHFGTVDGKPLGYSLGGSGGAGLSPMEDGTPAYRAHWEDGVILPLEGLDALIFAPVTYGDDADGHQLPPGYDMTRAIRLTPVYSEAVAAAEAAATPEPTLTPEEADRLEDRISE